MNPLYLHGSDPEVLVQYHDALLERGIDSQLVYRFYKYQALDSKDPGGAYAIGLKYGILEPGFQDFDSASFLLSLDSLVKENNDGGSTLVNCDHPGARWVPVVDKESRTPVVRLEEQPSQEKTSIVWAWVPPGGMGPMVPVGSDWVLRIGAVEGKRSDQEPLELKRVYRPNAESQGKTFRILESRKCQKHVYLVCTLGSERVLFLATGSMYGYVFNSFGTSLAGQTINVGQCVTTRFGKKQRFVRVGQSQLTC